MLDNNRWLKELEHCFPLQLYSVSRRRAKTYNLKELEQLDGTCFDYRYMGTGKM
jgi:hypothetical protein